MAMIRPRHVLLLTHDAEGRADLAEGLQRAGHSVEIAFRPSGRLSPDLAIVDVATSELWSEAELLSTGRLILLVASTSDLRRGFGLGADDCVMPTAVVDEIVARCEASMRRTARLDAAGMADEPAVYADRRLWVNFGLRQVWAGGRSAHLTAREYRLLRFLVENADRSMSHEAILEGVWGRESAGARPTEVLKQYVWRLRQKVEEDPARPEIIVTVPGEGYRFVSLPG
jgi:two-component system KDP operon response regulator KdpE